MTTAGTLRRNIFAVSLLYSFQVGILLFFNSSFLLERGFTDSQIGVIFAAGYAFALATVLFIPKLLQHFGDRFILAGSLAATGFAFLAVSLTDSALVVAILIPLAIAISTNIYTFIDIFLTTVSGDIHKVAGRRGLYITVVHVGLVLAQLFGLFMLANGDLESLYVYVGLGLIALAIVSYLLLRNFRDATYTKADWPEIWQNLIGSPNLRNTFYVQFLLRVFYALMIIYTPVYLIGHVGIPLESIGFIFAFMLLPFVILEIPVGRLEDSVWHEREVLIVGFALTALTTAALAFITSPSVVLWALALFATRVGAALIDIGNEAYFFKHVHGSDTGAVSAYRMLSPLAHIIGPVIAALFVSFLPFQFLFIALGALMLVGIIPSSLLKG